LVAVGEDEEAGGGDEARIGEASESKRKGSTSTGDSVDRDERGALRVQERVSVAVQSATQPLSRRRMGDEPESGEMTDETA